MSIALLWTTVSTTLQESVSQPAPAESSFLDRVPTDPAAIFTLLLIVLAAVAVLWYGRPRGGGQNS